MNKTLLVAKREYLTRIRNKTFILSTLLTPLFFIGLIGANIYFTQNNSEEVNIAVYDESNLFASRLKSGKNITYSQVTKSVFDSVKKDTVVSNYDGALYIPSIDIKKPLGVEYLSNQQLGVFSQVQVEDDLNGVLEEERMIQANIDTVQLNKIKTNPINLKQTVIGEEGNTEANSGISYMVGFGSGLVIYMMMFIYGAMVMRGVMEEKVSRIAEVIVSSIKPTQLMMGKILGIGAVGLTQFLLWIILMLIGTLAFSGYIGAGEAQQLQEMSAGTGEDGKAMMAKGLQMTMGQINFPLIIGAFLFYFVTGYLFYASLFAAVGSAVNEDPQDAQSMMFPITIPIVLSFVMMSSIINNPSSGLAAWGSIIPFTSPIIMMARLPFGVPGTVPYWQLTASLICMILGILGVVWLCARIYRTGILMYGKKPSWKEMLKWVFIKR